MAFRQDRLLLGRLADGLRGFHLAADGVRAGRGLGLRLLEGKRGRCRRRGRPRRRNMRAAAIHDHQQDRPQHAGSDQTLHGEHAVRPQPTRIAARLIGFAP